MAHDSEAMEYRHEVSETQSYAEVCHHKSQSGIQAYWEVSSMVLRVCKPANCCHDSLQMQHVTGADMNKYNTGYRRMSAVNGGIDALVHVPDSEWGEDGTLPEHVVEMDMTDDTAAEEGPVVDWIKKLVAQANQPVRMDKQPPIDECFYALQWMARQGKVGMLRKALEEGETPQQWLDVRSTLLSQ